MRILSTISLLSCLLVGEILGVTTEWNDPLSGDFTDSKNWTNGVPGSNDTAVFPGTRPTKVKFSPHDSPSIQYLEINDSTGDGTSATTFTGKSSFVLTNGGTMTFGPGGFLILDKTMDIEPLGGLNMGNAGVGNAPILQLNRGTQIFLNSKADLRGGTVQFIFGGAFYSGFAHVNKFTTLSFQLKDINQGSTYINFLYDETLDQKKTSLVFESAYSSINIEGSSFSHAGVINLISLNEKALNANGDYLNTSLYAGKDNPSGGGFIVNILNPDVGSGLMLHNGLKSPTLLSMVVVAKPHAPTLSMLEMASTKNTRTVNYLGHLKSVKIGNALESSSSNFASTSSQSSTYVAQNEM